MQPWVCKGRFDVSYLTICRTLGVWVRHFLADRLRAMPGLGEQLEDGATVADVGCGCAEALKTLRHNPVNDVSHCLAMQRSSEAGRHTAGAGV